MALGALAGAVAAPIIGGIIGNEMGHEDRRKAREANQAALDAVLGLEPPVYNTENPDAPYLAMLQEQGLVLPDFAGVQGYSPEMQQAQTIGDTSMAGISTDPELRRAQMAALENMSRVASEGGMTAEDQFRMAQMQQQNARAERGSREALAQNMQQRGISGSGLELAAQLSNQQAAAEAARMEQLGIQAMAQQRALEAMTQAGSMGAQIRGQDFGEQSQIAQAQDAIAKFNAGQKTGVNAANVAAANQAALLQNQQGRDDAYQKQQAILQNMANNQNIQMQNNQLAQQNFGNQVGVLNRENQIKSAGFGDKAQIAGLQSSAYGNQGTNYNQAAAGKGAMGAGIGQGVGSAFSAFNQK